MRGKFAAVLRLTRIEHSLMLAIAVVAAELIAGGLPGPYRFLLALVPPILVSMAAFAINDYYDVETDRLNKKRRPLVEGALSMTEARNIAVILFVVGVATGALVNWYAFSIALAFAVLAWLYSYRLKEMLLVGNVYIAFTMVIPFIYGDFVVSRVIPANIVLVSFVIFLSGLAREVHGMMRDVKGDIKARHARSLVGKIGAMRSAAIALVLYVEAIAISLLMFFLFLPFAYNLVYIAPIVVSDCALLYVAIGHMYRRDARFYSLSRSVSLGAMSLALIAYLAAAILYIGV
jgi:4-hydroxybenzoate polyprenyltransferase